MIIPAENVYQALFDKVCQINSSSTPLITSSRRWRSWENYGDIAMPAFYQRQFPGAKLSQVRTFGPTRYLYHAELWFYFATDVNDFETVTSTVINNYLAAVDAILAPDVRTPGGARQQLGLGPQIEHCWIDGSVIMDEGLVVPSAILLIPVSILTG